MSYSISADDLEIGDIVRVTRTFTYEGEITSIGLGGGIQLDHGPIHRFPLHSESVPSNLVQEVEVLARRDEKNLPQQGDKWTTLDWTWEFDPASNNERPWIVIANPDEGNLGLRMPHHGSKSLNGMTLLLRGGKRVIKDD